MSVRTLAPGMEHLFFFKGLIVGFLIAAPTGPIGILCARRTLTQGRRAGFVSGMGAATADSIYGFIAAFGITFVSDMLSAHQFWLRLIGGTLLCFLGIRTYLAKPQERKARRSRKEYAGLYTSTFLLTLTNPMTILSLAVVFAGFGLAGTRGSMLSAGKLILGVFLGSGVWWLFLVGVFSLLNRKFDEHQLVWINKMAGMFITGSGGLALLTLHW